MMIADSKTNRCEYIYIICTILPSPSSNFHGNTPCVDLVDRKKQCCHYNWPGILQIYIYIHTYFNRRSRHIYTAHRCAPPILKQRLQISNLGEVHMYSPAAARDASKQSHNALHVINKLVGIGMKNRFQTSKNRGFDKTRAFRFCFGS